jgi:hypothetical protein
MTFLDNLDGIVANGEFEHCDALIGHELRGNCAASHLWIPLGAPSNILLCLNDTNLIASTLCLHGDDVMAAMAINPEIKFVDFDLADASNCRS